MIQKWITPALILLSCLAGSCTKHSEAVPAGKGTVEFVANGVPFSWTGADTGNSQMHLSVSSVKSGNNTYLWVLAGSDYNSNFVLPFLLHEGPALPTGTYTYVGTVPGVQRGHELMGGVFSLQGISPLGYVDWFVTQADTVTVNVIDNDGIYASGTFSAQLGPFTNGVAQGTITTGSFINALVYPY